MKKDGMEKKDIRIPVSLLTGFLGAGKSTLLNRVLLHPDLHGTAVVINEYGAVGIDHHLVSSAPDDTALIANGCVCCTASGQLAQTLMDLFTRAQQRQFTLKRLVIETTGLAEPGPIIQQLLKQPRLAERFVLDTVTTLVDAVNAGHTLTHEDIAVQQLTAADCIVLTKSDLIDADQSDALEARLRRMNPDASVVRVLNGAALPEHLFTGKRRDRASPAFKMGGWFADAQNIRLVPLDLKNTSMLAMGFTQSASAAQNTIQDIQSFSIILDQAIPAARLFVWLDFIQSLCGPALLRVKGLVNLVGQAGPSVIHGVQKCLHPVTQMAAWPDEDHRTRIVFITRAWGRDRIALTQDFLARGATAKTQNPEKSSPEKLIAEIT